MYFEKVLCIRLYNSQDKTMHRPFKTKLLCTLCFTLCFMIHDLSSQYSRGNYNFFDFQSKSHYFGLSLSYNQSQYRINHSKTLILNDSISVAEAKSGPGLGVNAVVNLKIGQYFDFRVLPGFSIYERSIQYKSPELGGQYNTIKIEPVIVNTAFLLRFKSVPYKDKRAFVVTGVNYSYDVQSNIRVRAQFADSVLKISPHDFQIEVGAGVQFFMPYFILSPEIKLSQGIGNTLIYNNQLEESNVLEKLFTRVLTFTVHFEG